MPVDLRTVAQEYLEDTDHQSKWRDIAKSRQTSLATLTPIVEQFAAGSTDLATMRTQVNRALLSTNDWGATGHWMQTLNKLSLNHPPVGEPALRSALQGLDAQNLGTRIGRFISFLYEERERFRREGKALLSMAFPGSGPWLISLFAYWLDQRGRPVILYPSTARAVKLLLDAGIVPKPEGLRMDNDGVVVRTDSDYDAVARAIESLRAAGPSLVAPGLEGYWVEAFFTWLSENPDVLRETVTVAGIDSDTTEVIPHAPLPATQPALLQRLIAELRREILIEDELVRRIYHALLAGHVILSGPPGTGKTELARLIPELLWQREVSAGANTNPLGPTMAMQRDTSAAFATRLVTATDEWSVRTLIGGLAPGSEGGQPVYRIQLGHLTRTIFDNWAISEGNPAGWGSPQRKSVRAPSVLGQGQEREFRGRWLIIDEFNRAPIDLALGEALTALGGSGALRVPVDGGSAELPLPKDFRIIGTLNSFDRNYLNQISEALKRRFAFIEVPPPTRARREAEQAIVLVKVLRDVAHLSNSAIQADAGGAVRWVNVVTLTPQGSGGYALTWATPEPALRASFGFLWNVFEVIRIYRQLGTAQAIALLRQTLIAGVVQQFTTVDQWVGAADLALCDTVADQLQLLLPDELDVLIAAFTAPDRAVFTRQLNATLQRLMSSPRRLAAQVAALNAVVDSQGDPIVRLADDPETYADQPPEVAEAEAVALFHWQNPGYALPQFVRRLRAFKAERGL
jgi:hypothetical protein